jgi:small-conductance mechanosensitive channel
VTRAPWEYLFESFNSFFFPDVFWPTVIASIVGLVAVVLLYNIRTRRLHRHRPYLDLWEWLLWTGLITFSLLLVGALFAFDFILVLATAVIGVATLVWIRFRRFPPVILAYERQLARQRYVSRQRASDPETTIRRRGGGRRQRRRR